MTDAERAELLQDAEGLLGAGQISLQRKVAVRPKLRTGLGRLYPSHVAALLAEVDRLRAKIKGMQRGIEELQRINDDLSLKRPEGWGASVIVEATAPNEAPKENAAELDALRAEVDRLRAEVAAEREACASLVEATKCEDNQGNKLDYWHNQERDEIAAAIRARGKPAPALNEAPQVRGWCGHVYEMYTNCPICFPKEDKPAPSLNEALNGEPPKSQPENEQFRPFPW